MIWELWWVEVELKTLVPTVCNKVMEDASAGNLPENGEGSIFVLVFSKMYLYNNLGFLTSIFILYSVKIVLQMELNPSSVVLYCFSDVIYVNSDANP